ncbi:1,4-dihydroxy-2-naphthoate prenyltransferase [Roseimicrobium gellanilyticum]|uniref:1,4-dihydroxy-2-naphthoate octaprenyltransferase n=1 Tax=Roseimicrobium gellanilyticum TaxID=748857 RepID=A0A366HMX8_9BACT|nr:1,4-dihydroxy-2-naphthoate polyprenyltransferase [Roseimicrobium gellanilyticum]RBP44509.1 1,4-dihydroxy-2-naphthoate prenyltransferase [Roseimicrobium gellanilyticum]
MPSKITPWILAARPKTLGAAIAPVLVGSALGAKLGGEFCVWLMLATLGSCICLQIATNLFNDAVDGMKGSDTKERLGPTRITASGMMAPRTVLLVAAGVLVVATLLAVPLIIYRGWPIIAIGIPSLWFCYGYTGGPLPLAYRGLGELFVVLFFGLVAVTGSAYVQSGQWHVEALVAGLQVGMLSTVLIAINNFRDVDEDTKTGKRTLAVRFGKKFARWEIVALITGVLLVGMLWLFAIWPGGMRYPHACALPVLCIFLMQAIRKDIKAEPSEALNRTLAKAGALLVLFSILFSIGFSFGCPVSALRLAVP